MQRVRKGLQTDVGFDDFDVIDKLINGSPMGLLSNLNSLFDSPVTKAMICPTCKTTSEEFLKTGFVGCPRCYDVFEPLIVQTVKKLQQSDRHVGKKPTGAVDFSQEEARLKAELHAAVDKGDYVRIGEISNKLNALMGERTGD